MDRDELKKLLDHVADGSISPETALNDISLAQSKYWICQLDLARGIRQGAGEVIYGAGKTADQITGIVTALHASGQKRILITRLDKQKALAVTSSLSQHSLKLNWDETSHLALLAKMPSQMELALFWLPVQEQVIYPLPKKQHKQLSF